MTREEFAALALEQFDQLQEINQLDDFYAYEKAFEGVWTEFGRQALEKNIGKLPENHRKKTFYGPVMGR